MIAYHSDTFFTMNSEHLLRKAMIDFEELKKDVNPSHIFNFFVTAYHIKDYLVKQYAISEKDDIRSVPALNDLLHIAGYIANRGKHWDLNDKKYSNMSTRCYTGKYDGVMEYDATHSYSNGQSYRISCEPDRVYDVLEVAENLLNALVQFFRINSFTMIEE